MIVPPFKPSEYTEIVNKWIDDHRKPRRKFYLVTATFPIKGRWQEWPIGKQFIGYRARDGWRAIALKMRVRFPVVMCCIPNSKIEVISEFKGEYRLE